MIFEFVPLHDVMHLLALNKDEHYSNVESKEEERELNINWAAYLEQSLLGNAYASIVKDGDIMVGYSVYLLNRNTHYQDIIQALCTLIFIKKEHRGKLFSELLNDAANNLRDMGVHEVIHMVNNDSYGRFLERKGYKDKFKIWSKKL